MGRLARATGDGAALAPGIGAARVVRLRPAPRTGATAAAQRGARPHPSAGDRELTVRLPTHPRQVAEAGPRRLGERCPDRPASERRPARTPPIGAVLARLPARAC